MEVFSLANSCLLKIIENKTPFHAALKELFKEHDDVKNKRADVTSLVGCELRHHYFLEVIVKDLDLNEKSLDKLLSIYLVLANLYFLKKFSLEECHKHLNLILEKEDLEKLEKLLIYSGSPLDLIPSSINRNSDVFASIRFNTPRWLIKMWQKQFGRGITFKIIKSLSKTSNQTFRVNDKLADKEQILLANKDYFVNTKTKDIINYVAKGNLKKNELTKSFNIYPMNEAVKKIFDDLNLNNEICITLFTDKNVGMIYELFMHSDKREINIAVPNIILFPDVINQIRSNEQYRKINFFSNNDLSFLDADISSKQDLVIVNPSSSYFDTIKKQPDYLINFEKTSLTNCINNEFNSVEGISKIVSDNGRLVYIVETLNIKESKTITSMFLEAHKDFFLLEEKQYLSYDEYGSNIYYAIFQKDGGNK